MLDAWGGSLAYTLQLYLDFSGYSDMALGLGHLFGIRLPINFDVPYKATSIADFWRRWHITLSSFLRDYLYIPLGGNRRGFTRTQLNVMITFLLGGLWHGAGWTFVVWGALHGFFVVTQNLWERITAKRALPTLRPLSWVLTFLSVVVAWGGVSFGIAGCELCDMVVNDRFQHRTDSIHLHSPSFGGDARHLGHHRPSSVSGSLGPGRNEGRWLASTSPLCRCNCSDSARLCDPVCQGRTIPLLQLLDATLCDQRHRSFRNRIGNGSGPQPIVRSILGLARKSDLGPKLVWDTTPLSKQGCEW